MITIASSQLVARDTLSKQQLWSGLVRKAENPVGFLAGMKSSRITERFEQGFIREVVHGDQTIVERVTLFEPAQVTFERTAGDAQGWVTNIISDSPEGLMLTFVAHLPDAQASDRDTMQQMFAQAVTSTLVETRRLLERNEL